MMLSANPVCCSALRSPYLSGAWCQSTEGLLLFVKPLSPVKLRINVSGRSSKFCRGRWFIIADSFGVVSNVGHIVQGSMLTANDADKLLGCA